MKELPGRPGGFFVRTTAVTAFAACEELVRRHDPDRYFSALFAPTDKRHFLFALYALYYEMAHVADAVREPMVGDIRLAWWRETVEGARAGKARNHDVARALVETLAANDLPQHLFEAIIAARAFDVSREPFADMETLEEYCDATSGNMMRLAARVLGAGDTLDAPVREAGIAFALAGRYEGRFRIVQPHLARTAQIHLAAARRFAIPREALPAFLPAALVPLYLRRSEPALWRRQISLFTSAARGRI